MGFNKDTPSFYELENPNDLIGENFKKFAEENDLDLNELADFLSNKDISYCDNCYIIDKRKNVFIHNEKLLCESCLDETRSECKCKECKEAISESRMDAFRGD